MTNQTRPLFLASALVLATVSTVHASETTRQLDAHAHGHASLNVAIDNNSLIIEFESPAANIVGFEHEPENDEQKAALMKARETLATPANVFVLPAGAGCKLTEADVDAPHSEHADEKHDDHKHDEKHEEKHEDKHKHDEKHEKEDGEVHSEFHATWMFECDAVDKLDSLEVKIFDRFPGTEEIDASIIGRTGQSAKELTPSDKRIEL